MAGRSETRMQKRLKSGRSRTRLSSVSNAMRLITAFSEEEYEIGVSDLARRLGLAKSTVHRLATTLIETGMLEQNPQDGTYHLGLKLFELGSLVRRKMDVTNEAQPFLKELREKTGETVQLGIVDHASDSTIWRTLKKTLCSPIAASTGSSRPRPTAHS